MIPHPRRLCISGWQTKGNRNPNVIKRALFIYRPVQKGVRTAINSGSPYAIPGEMYFFQVPAQNFTIS
jgi:hypothetical protein